MSYYEKILSFILVLLVLFVLTGLTGCDENVSGDIASSADETEIYTQTDDENTSNESMPSKPREGIYKEIINNVYSNYGDIRVNYLDVGQGDWAFIELSNGQTMLIDARNPQSRADIVNYIKSLQYSI